MASSKNPTEADKVKEMEKKTGIESGEKRVKVGSGTASDPEAEAIKKLERFKEVEWVARGLA